MSRHAPKLGIKTSRRDRARWILAGDIGGTKTRIGLFAIEGTRIVPIDEQRFSSRDHGGLDEILGVFSSTRRGARPAAAAFGIAGPVVGGRSRTTNLPWVIDAKKLARRLKVPVALLNDMEATAHSLPVLSPRSVAVLNPGRPARDGTLALVAAGTGLGEAFVLRRDGRFIAGATEGGHSDFAPGSPEEIDLLRFLRERFGHVSVERVVSGSGLVNIYEFLGIQRPELSPVPGLRESSSAGAGRALRPAEGLSTFGEGGGRDPAALISEAALEGTSRRAMEALRIFVSAYGAEVGNLALKVLSTGGVYIAGGIAPKILPALRDGVFMNAFLSKGRFRSLLEAMPVKVVLDDRAALLGAARAALALARPTR